MKVGIRRYYTISSWDILNLPEGKTWNDVVNAWIKWDTLHYQLKGENTYREFQLSDPIFDAKYPDNFEIFAVDECEFPIGESLAEY